MAWCRHHLLPLLSLAFMLGIAAAQQLAPRLAPDSPFIAILLAAIALCLIALLCCSPRRALVWAGLPLFCCTGVLHN